MLSTVSFLERIIYGQIIMIFKSTARMLTFTLSYSYTKKIKPHFVQNLFGNHRNRRVLIENEFVLTDLRHTSQFDFEAEPWQEFHHL